MWPYQIDWSATGSFWSGLGSIALAVTAVFAATEWRRQYRATKITDVAVAVISVTHETYFLLKKKMEIVWSLSGNTLETGELSWDEANLLAVVCSFSDKDSARIRSKIEAIYEGGFFLSSVLGPDFDIVMAYAETANGQVNALEKISYFFDLRTKSEPDSLVLELTPSFEELLRRLVYVRPNAELDKLSKLKEDAQTILSAQLKLLSSQPHKFF